MYSIQNIRNYHQKLYFGFLTSLHPTFLFYFFRKSRQKASLLSNRFAFKGVRSDIILFIKALQSNTYQHYSLTSIRTESC